MRLRLSDQPVVAQLDAVLGAFVLVNVTPVNKVVDTIDTAVAAKQAEIHDFLAGAVRPLRAKP